MNLPKGRTWQIAESTAGKGSRLADTRGLPLDNGDGVEYCLILNVRTVREDDHPKILVRVAPHVGLEAGSVAGMRDEEPASITGDLPADTLNKLIEAAVLSAPTSFARNSSD